MSIYVKPAISIYNTISEELQKLETEYDALPAPSKSTRQRVNLATRILDFAERYRKAQTQDAHLEDLSGRVAPLVTAATTTLETCELDTECPVCYKAWDKVAEKVAFSCGHIFCEACGAANPLKCPSCNADSPAELPSKEVLAYVANELFGIADRVALLDALRKHAAPGEAAPNELDNKEHPKNLKQAAREFIRVALHSPPQPVPPGVVNALVVQQPAAQASIWKTALKIVGLVAESVAPSILAVLALGPKPNPPTEWQIFFILAITLSAQLSFFSRV